MIHVVEQVELLRHLPTGKQLVYRAALVLLLTAMLLFSIALAIVLAVLLTTLVFGTEVTIEGSLTIGFPVAVAFLGTIGFSSSQAVPGQRLWTVAWVTARGGLINGLISGLIFGVLWYFLLGFGAFVREDWAYLFRPQLMLYGLLFGLALAPTFAVFKAFATVLPDALLHWLKAHEVA